jgi:hypothetical protein
MLTLVVISEEKHTNTHTEVLAFQVRVVFVLLMLITVKSSEI